MSKIRIMIVSDTHGNNRYLNKAIEEAGAFDLFLHLGDLEGSEHFIDAFVQSKKEMIAGNNDYYVDYPNEKIIEVAGYRIWMTHGHRYQVYTGVSFLRDAAIKKGVDIVLFGHIHQPYLEQEDLIILNPGSISLPRQSDRIPTYAIMEIDEQGEISIAINRVGQCKE
ncbi:MAG: metallophosphoesterase [Lachnospiraceae bacterium]|nr:metallophosphoesterase [Lachnospiraceae bacterium]